jgi:flagellar protein FlaF
MAFGFDQYQRAGNTVASPRELEAQVFNFVNRHLKEAEAGSDVPKRIHALHRNHKLWSLLVKDVAHTGNRLPEPLKQNILRLGFWAMSYSTLAIAKPMELEPLISVNQHMIDALTTPPPTPDPTPAGVTLSGVLTA